MTNDYDDVEENVPEQSFSEVPKESNKSVSTGTPGEVYDWSKAPDGVKAPPRLTLDGKTVTIKKCDIVLPPQDQKWELTRKKDKEFKFCTFVLFYDFEGQQEFVSGVRVFKRDGDMYSPPTITRDRKSQASKLLGAYADFKKKDINEVSLREFMGFLNSTPKAVLIGTTVKNPVTGEEITKNLVESFVE